MASPTIGAELAAWLRDYMKGMAGENFLLSTSTGCLLHRTYCTKLRHRLSKRAWLPRLIAPMPSATTALRGWPGDGSGAGAGR